MTIYSAVNITKEEPPATPPPCSITTAVIRSIRTLKFMMILEGQTRRPGAWSPQSRTVPQQRSYHALIVMVSLACSVARSVRIADTGVAMTSRRPAILVISSSSQMMMSCVKITCSGETSNVTTIILIMATCSAIGHGVRAPYKRLCIHGTTLMMATLASGRSQCSHVQTSQTR